MTDATLDSRRSEAERRLAEGRRRRGAAVLDDGDLGHAVVAEAAATVEALDEAEAEQVRRQRAADAAAGERRRAEIRAEVRLAEQRRREATAAAEQAARDMVANLLEVEREAETINAAAVKLGLPAPTGLSVHSIRDHFSDYVTALFFAAGARTGYGRAHWNSPRVKATVNWAEAEKARVLGGINALLSDKPAPAPLKAPAAAPAVDPEAPEAPAGMAPVLNAAGETVRYVEADSAAT